MTGTNLMGIWNQKDAEETLRGLGNKALSVFIASSKIQDILKDADPSYEMIYPYKMVTVEEQEKDKDGNLVFDISYEYATDEETGEEKVVNEIKTPVMKMVKKKILLKPTFKEDGSLDELVEI